MHTHTNSHEYTPTVKQTHTHMISLALPPPLSSWDKKHSAFFLQNRAVRGGLNRKGKIHPQKDVRNEVIEYGFPGSQMLRIWFPVPCAACGHGIVHDELSAWPHIQHFWNVTTNRGVSTVVMAWPKIRIHLTLDAFYSNVPHFSKDGACAMKLPRRDSGPIPSLGNFSIFFFKSIKTK